MFGFKYIEEPVRIDKPILSEDQFAEMQEKIIGSLENKTELEFTLYNKGLPKKVTGVVTLIKNQHNKLCLVNDLNIDITDVIEINYK